MKMKNNENRPPSAEVFLLQKNNRNLGTVGEDFIENQDGSIRLYVGDIVIVKNDFIEVETFHFVCKINKDIFIYDYRNSTKYILDNKLDGKITIEKIIKFENSNKKIIDIIKNNTGIQIVNK